MSFLSLLAESGFSIQDGKHLTFVHADFKQNVRMDTLGDVTAIVNGDCDSVVFLKKR